jgi:hypothetical protein
MATEAPGYAWRRTSGVAPDAVKAARPVLNGEDEETGRKVLRLVLTQLEGGCSGYFAAGDNFVLTGPHNDRHSCY